jgi:hypothetical protein
MTDDRKPKTQKTTPKGIDPKTGEPYEPVEIPPLKRKAFDGVIRRAATHGEGSRRGDN